MKSKEVQIAFVTQNGYFRLEKGNKQIVIIRSSWAIVERNSISNI